MKRHKIVLAMCLVLSFVLVVPVFCGMAEASDIVPYDTYTYNYYDEIRYTPPAYVPKTEIDGSDWENGGLKDPQDFYIDNEGFMYIADTGNSRIVVLKNYEYVKEIKGFYNEGVWETFARPKGVYVSLKGNLYIADTENNRVVALDSEGNCIQMIHQPKSEVLEEGFVFIPNKVAVDYADRIFVISQNMYQGIMAFDTEGEFTGFVGTVNVVVSAYERFWRRFSTKEQRAKQELFIPTEFTGMDIDLDGFVYATNVDSEGEQSIRKLNPKGEDVIQSSGKPLSGDRVQSQAGDYSGASSIVDVIVRSHGMYSMLDSKRGRIFTYDSEGNLLYTFGGMGTQKGTFKTPVAIETWENDLLVLDGGNSALILFEQTDYGNQINQAIRYHYDGDEEQSVACWEEALKYDSNLEMAHDGIGKSYLATGENKLAMEQFEQSKNQSYYSIAFRRYRNEFLQEYLQIFLTIVVVATAVIVVFVKTKSKWRKKGRKQK